MSRPRTRSPIPVDCDCTRVTHTHGTRQMYGYHACGCDLCHAAYTSYQNSLGRRAEARKAAESATGPVTAAGLFVATFPYYGGYSRERLQRKLRPEVAEMAEAQGVRLLPGDPQIRIDRTGAGVFVVVTHPAESSRPMSEVRERAAVMAYEHEQAHPRLASWISKQLEEVAA